MKIACVLANGFEDSEFKEPYDAFRAAGHEVTIVGLEAGAQIEGSKGKVKATIERSFKQVSPDDEAVSFVKAFMRKGKPVFAICHGPQLLLTADEYKGHRMTAWKTVQGDLEKAGADVVDREVV